MTAGAPGSVRAPLSWMQNSPALDGWLKAVAAAPDQFAVSFVSRSVIAGALRPNAATYPSLSEDTLEPWAWMELGISRRLHRDAIMARFPPTALKSVVNWETMGQDSIRRSKSPHFFGDTTVASMAALWWLRYPATSSWRAKFGLTSFLADDAATPQLRELRKIKVFVSSQEPVLALETIDEFEEAQALQNPSPGSAAVKQAH